TDCTPAPPVRQDRNRRPCFVESPHSFFRMHWGAEPVSHKLPCIGTLNRSESPSTALRAPSPPLGEKDGMRGSSSCPLSLLRMHWDHESTPNPSQEGNWESTEECQLPSLPSARPSRFQAPVNPARAAGSRHTFSRAPTRHRARKTFPGAV